MAITLSTAARNAACSAVVNLCNQGAAPGKLKIKATSTVLCTITLGDPAFGAPATGVATAAGLPLSGTASAAGVANAYDVTDSDDNVLWSGVTSMTGGGGDLILDNTNIAISQSVSVSSWTHTAPATV